MARRLSAALLIGLIQLHPLMAQAAPSFKPGTCSKVSAEVCVDATPCKLQSNGLTLCLAGINLPETTGGSQSLAASCWEYSTTYTCLEEASFDDCAAYKAKGCGQVGSTCSYRMPNGTCTVYDQTYQCQLTPPKSTSTTDCSEATICSNGNCWATPQTNYSQDFGSAMAGMEIARQAAVYKDCDASGNCTFFKGVGSQCNEGYFGSGMGNCCMTSGVQASDHSVLASTGMSLAMQGGLAGAQASGNAIAQWTYSYMYSSNPEFLWDLMSSSSTAMNLAGDAGAGTLFGSGASVGAFGFSVGSASTAAGGLTGGGNIVLYNFSSGAAVGGESAAAYAAAEGGAAASETVLAFNPYVFAAIVAYMVITEMMKCTEDEQVLSLKRGTNLCVQADRWCSQKEPLVGCVRHSQSYCCYNSLLAKAINVQGRAQVGRPIGGGQGSPDCSGLTLDEMQRIDFSRVDFSEFISSVTQGTYGTSMTDGQASAVNSSLQNKMLNRCANGATPDSTGHCPTTP